MIDRDVALVNVRSMDQRLQRDFLAQPRFSVLVLGIFAGTGLLLVALGVYGVMAYTVSQQTRDIAIRMALGGERSHVLRMVFRTGMGLLVVGTLVGLGASLATNRLVASQFPNLSPHDSQATATVVALIAAIGLMACWVPARRAMRVHPMTALRHD